MRERFQAALNGALGSYLHGGNLTRAGRILFPLVDRARPSPFLALRRAAEPLGLVLPDREADALACAYEALDGLPVPDLPIDEFELAGWDAARHGTVSPLSGVRAQLLDIARRTDLEFFVHGSFATLDFTDYSDLDTLVLVPRATACDPAALVRGRRALVETWRALKDFDPLQHHGHFVLTEIDLRGYPEPLFPRVLFDRMVTLTSQRRVLRIRALPAPGLAAARFESIARRYLDTDLQRGLRNAYCMKSDLSVFMLLPALFANAHGKTMAKKDSFPVVYRLLSPGSVAVFEKAAMIRHVWRYHEPAWNRWLRRLWINPLLPAALDAARARPPARDVRQLADVGFLSGTKTAVRELLELHHGGSRERTTPRDQVA